MRLLRGISGRLLLNLIVGIALVGGSVARAQDTAAVAQITAPGDGAHLFGPVNITGSAQHPSAFDRYTLEYDLLSEVGADWFLVQEPVTQQVQDGVLGTWDTSAVPDGVYQLRLRVHLDGGDFTEVTVSNLRVQNSQPTPVPTTGPAGALPGQIVATPGPTPTSPIVQPPTVIPQLALDSEPDAPESVGAAPDSSLLQRESGASQINFSRARQAFCTGGLITAGVFLALAAYYAGRRLSRNGPRSPLARDDY